ncbi:hypothetical protein QEG73_21860 [Chitinophagaceae bacterium 26-R-25]|nr:hypothetical protein [Chitinophagaceae bacterium 26-R-25]
MPEEKEIFDPKKLEWFECLEILLIDFEPADHRDQADLFWSTPEIKRTIETMFGSDYEFKITDNNIYKCMLFLDYHYTSNGGCNLEWMIKRKG